MKNTGKWAHSEHTDWSAPDEEPRAARLPRLQISGAVAHHDQRLHAIFILSSAAKDEQAAAGCTVICP